MSDDIVWNTGQNKADGSIHILKSGAYPTDLEQPAIAFCGREFVPGTIGTGCGTSHLAFLVRIDKSICTPCWEAWKGEPR